MDLKGKTAWVGGATQGIGKAIAESMAAAGANIVLVARNPEVLASLCDVLPRPVGQAHHWVSADYTLTDSLKTQVKEYLQNHPEGVDILINNTGGPPGGVISQAETQAFLDAFQQHLICNQILTQTFLPGMITRKQGRIINIISTSVKQPLKGLGVSNTIRAAVAGWAKTLAGEVAIHGVTVNNILPGATATERLYSLIRAKAEKSGHSPESIEAEMLSEIPAGRFARAEDIAAAALFLAGSSAAYITGINLPVDGGRTSCL